MQPPWTAEIENSSPSQDTCSDTDTSSTTREIPKRVHFAMPKDNLYFPHGIYSLGPASQNSSQELGYDSDKEYGDEDGEMRKFVFSNIRRMGYGRQSERPARSRYNPSDSNKEYNPTFVRNELLRRSVRETRSPVAPRVPIVTTKIQSGVPQKVSKSKLAALWRRLTGTSKKSKEKEEKSKKKPERFCTYAGVSDDFKRIQKGREIAIVICGSQKVGKSSFMSSVMVNAALSSQMKPLRKEERFPDNFTLNRLPYIISFKYMHDGVEWIIDIIETPSPSRNETDEMTREAYYRACDAAVFIVSSKNNETALDALSNIKALKSRSIPFVMVNNDYRDPDVNARNKDILRKLADKMGVDLYESDLNKADDFALEPIRTVLTRVIDARIQDDVQRINIWGT